MITSSYELVEKDRRHSSVCEGVGDGVEAIEGASEEEKRMAKLRRFRVITTAQKMMDDL